MWDIIKAWFADLGEFLFQFTKTAAAQFIKKYGPIATRCVMEAAATPGLDGRAKFVMAGQLLLMEVPGAAQYLIDTAVQTAYAVWKEKEAKSVDRDGDGVPDYRDMCADLGVPPGGCVTPEGCPDSDCDGVPDHLDPCPHDATCK
jgi:hypothetical protein